MGKLGQRVELWVRDVSVGAPFNGRRDVDLACEATGPTAFGRVNVHTKAPECFAPRDVQGGRGPLVFVGGIGADPVLARLDPAEPVFVLHAGVAGAATFLRAMACLLAAGEDVDHDPGSREIVEAAGLVVAVAKNERPASIAPDTFDRLRGMVRITDDVRAMLDAADAIEAWRNDRVVAEVKP